jgi:hypothetical protein
MLIVVVVIVVGCGGGGRWVVRSVAPIVSGMRCECVPGSVIDNN